MTIACKLSSIQIMEIQEVKKELKRQYKILPRKGK